MAIELSNNTQSRTTYRPTHEEIAQRAYQIFLEKGQPQGHDEENWLEAEAQLMAQHDQKSSASPDKPQILQPRATAPSRRSAPMRP